MNKHLYLKRKEGKILREISALTVGLLVGFGLNSSRILAHGTEIQYTQMRAIALTAQFDTGKPISNAQVLIYAPNKPQEVWQRGETDEEGNFFFIPDYNISGNWTVKVRSAGHGDIVNIPIQGVNEKENTAITSPSGEEKEMVIIEKQEDKMQSSAATGNLSNIQKFMMAITGSWGFIGTALFFSRSKKV